MAVIAHKFQVGPEERSPGLIVPGVGVSFRKGSVISGQVVRVYDGDTFKLKMTVGQAVIRIWGIDAPESDQQYGDEATAALWTLCGGAQVAVLIKDRDRWGRIVGEVFNAESINIGNEMIRQGLAWFVAKFAKMDQTKRTLELEARNKKRGLWLHSGQLPPWLWRKKHTKPATPRPTRLTEKSPQG